MKRGKRQEIGKICLLILFMASVLFWGEKKVSAFPAPLEESVLGELRAGKEEQVQVRFVSGSGKIYSGMTQTVTQGESLVLPAVPGYEGQKNSGWKLEKDTPATEGFTFLEGEILTFAAGDGLEEYVENGVFCLYAVEPCRVAFWNNAGTAAFDEALVFPGSVIKLPDFPRSNYKNYGWTDLKKGTAVKYGFGTSFTVERDWNLYIIRYNVSKFKTVSFFNSSGGTNQKFRALNTSVLQNQKTTLPAVPALAGYQNLGWSTKKNASRATYAEGARITVKKDISLYAVRKKLPVYKLTFFNNSGTSTGKAYTSLTIRGYKGKKVKLPSPPAVKGYKALGWTTVRKGKTAKYKAGDAVTITKARQFFAVYKKIKYYNVEFYNSNGKAGSAFKTLKKNVAAGSAVTLPSPPAKSGYVAVGWSTVKNASAASYQSGSKLKIKGNTALYAVYKTSVTVTLCKNNGTLLKKVKIAKGDYYTLPAVMNEPSYTMLGWSVYPNKTTMGSGVNGSTEFEVGQSIRVSTDRKFYAVIFNRNKEPDYNAASLPVINASKYRKVIFVGDSRTKRMRTTLNCLDDTSFLKNVSWVAEGGKTLGWLNLEAYSQLLEEVGSGGKLPTAVIFNLGVNDLDHKDNYVDYMKSIAPELQKRGCKLFYMSVNPINSENLKQFKSAGRTEQKVRIFNSTIKDFLCSGTDAAYTYIDTYSYLLNTGYGLDSGSKGVDSGIDDGLHYSVKTYKRIYKYCIDAVNRK